MMEGFGVHTFRFVNEQGKGRFVKFHWKPLLGVHSLVWDESQKLAGKDPDYHRRDLWDAMDNFFAETEQVAFHAGNVVSGIDFTNDPLLQGRLFSYLDTQLIRLGGPNFHELPINRLLAKVNSNQRDGFHRMTIDRGVVSYSPNSLRDGAPEPASDEEQGYVHYMEKVDGRKVRERSASFKDHYRQATLFWNSMSDVEKQHIAEAFHFEVGGVMDKQIRQRVVDMFNNVDAQLAMQIAVGIGAIAPAVPGGTGVTASSPAVSQEQTIMEARTRKVAILAGDGFDFAEVTQVMQALQDGGVHSEIVSKNLGMITGADGQQLDVSKNYVSAGSIMYDAVYVAGGPQNVDTLLTQGDALHFINEAFKHCKTIGAANEGVDLLAATNIGSTSIAGTESQSRVVNDLGVVTIRNASDMGSFSTEFIDSIARHRHWTRHKEPVPA